MNIVILMAGSEEQFIKKGYSYPKPLIEVNNKPIIQHVVEGIKPFIKRGDRIIFIVKEKDVEKYYLNNTIKLLAPNSFIISTSGDTSGGAISALLSIEFVDTSDSLLIINGDQIIEENLLGLVNHFDGLDAGVVVFNSIHPRWSYVACDKDGYVVEAAEKNPISDLATAGFYYYKRSNDYFEATKSMIMKDSHLQGAFYVCPVFNEMILNHKKIGVHKIDIQKYHSLMTPKMVLQYENYLIASSK